MPSELRKDLETLVSDGYPYETCGLLVGDQSKGCVRLVRVVGTRNLNIARARDRYELDPMDFAAADGEARRDGLEIVGIWHSHPDHPALPSQTDRTQAWEGWSYVIASVTKEGVVDLRSWRLEDEIFIEEVIES